ncbi:MAG TPA: hypothetical protein PLV92_07410 [Pirellulaceae bacterium]|nr:hypothetical protein [Pirellulaceae bacterium]
MPAARFPMSYATRLARRRSLIVAFLIATLIGLPSATQRSSLVAQTTGKSNKSTAPKSTAPKSSGAKSTGTPAAAPAPVTKAPLDGFAKLSGAELDKAAKQLESWAVEQTWSQDERRPEAWVAAIRELLDARQIVDRRLSEQFEQRKQFADQPAGEERREAASDYLRTTSRLIDISGRLRSLTRDAIDNATFALTAAPAQLDQMLEILAERKSQIGAITMSYALFDPPAEQMLDPFPAELKRKVLGMIAASRPLEMCDDLGEFIRDRKSPPNLVVAAAEALREVGLPQDPRAGQPEDLPKPAITAAELRDVLVGLAAEELNDEAKKSRTELIAWAKQRADKGVVDDSYRLGECDVRPGDWLLMRNPSPYNLFTDHSPGLFTHVGIVAVERDSRGKRRFVVVDLPERGDRIPATNIEIFVQRTLHYVVLRHPDERTAERIGEVAASLIGRPSTFDLQFRTQRVFAQKGVSTNGRSVNTYCAGFLLLCALETSAPRTDFFPIYEQPAGGRCPENLAKLGLSMGRDFVSPTGAMFSSKLELVGRCEPSYEPGREIQESIYDFFARSMISRRLTPSPDTMQALRERLGAASRKNRAMAKALAKANGVSDEMDLEAASKAASVIETLDEIAERAVDDFVNARDSIMATDEDLARLELSAEEQLAMRRYRREHASLYQSWTAGKLTPTQLRVALVDYYRSRGVRQLDERFFR